VLDAGGHVLGRVATQAATLLRGKHKPIFAPHMDTGDHVIVINADKVELTGGKETKKFAYRHSGYPGGITKTSYGRLLAEKPVFAVEKAVRGMLPKNRLGRAMIKKLHVVAGPEHPHAAQKPKPLTLTERPAWDGLPEKRAQATPAVKLKAPERAGKTEPTAEVTATSTASSKATKSPARKPTTPKPTGSAPAKRSTAKSPARKTEKKARDTKPRPRSAKTETEE
jgi:large subunit ribosomal protein L13